MAVKHYPSFKYDLPPRPKTPHFTDRQREVIALLGRGYRQRDLARLFKITRSGVGRHVAAIRKKVAASGLKPGAAAYPDYLRKRVLVRPK